MWVVMWLVVVMAGCPPQNGSEDGAPVAPTIAKEHTARGSTQVQPWLRRRREEPVTMKNSRFGASQ